MITDKDLLSIKQEHKFAKTHKSYTCLKPIHEGLLLKYTSLIQKQDSLLQSHLKSQQELKLKLDQCLHEEKESLVKKYDFKLQ